MSLPSFSFRVFVSCFRIFLQLLCLLALIYSFSPEMGFINHCNAALGKMVLSVGRNTSPLTAPAGRATPACSRFRDRLLMVFAFYVCARAIGAGPQGALPVPPPSYFKPPPAFGEEKKTKTKLLLPASAGGREKVRAGGGREQPPAVSVVPTSDAHGS